MATSWGPRELACAVTEALQLRRCFEEWCLKKLRSWQQGC